MSSLKEFFARHTTAAVAISAVAAFVLDRWCKYAALQGAVFGDQDAIVRFALFLNHGIAFSIPVPHIVFWIAAVVAFGLLCMFFLQQLRVNQMNAAVLFMIILGAISNAFDRIAYGATVDYAIFFGVSAVNIADAMIVAGLLATYRGIKKSSL